MQKLRVGNLFFDKEMGRYDIRFKYSLKEPSAFYGGLHCGECFEVEVPGTWMPVRIELGDDWYLVGLPNVRLDGLTVRI